MEGGAIALQTAQVSTFVPRVEEYKAPFLALSSIKHSCWTATMPVDPSENGNSCAGLLSGCANQRSNATAWQAQNVIVSGRIGGSEDFTQYAKFLAKSLNILINKRLIT